MPHSRPGVRIVLALATPMPPSILETAKEGTRIRQELWRNRRIDVLELRSAQTSFHPTHGLAVTLPGQTEPAATFNTSCFFEVQDEHRQPVFTNPYFCEKCGRVSGVCITALAGRSTNGHEQYRCMRCRHEWDGSRSLMNTSLPPVTKRRTRSSRLQTTT